tara:strand:- start:2681 stop:2941 length:261 start_codon:yes stop_codon:yes gene_type:complete
MKVEKQGLINLMKKNKIDRFKENNISELVYKIRNERYQQRINKISQSLPVLESRLDKLLKKEKIVERKVKKEKQEAGKEIKKEESK